MSDEKFWARTRPEGDCIVWVGYLTHGELPGRAVIRHSCDNPPCVEPTHLLEGTQADNIADRQARGRHRPGKLLGEAHPAHKLTEEKVREIREAYANGYSTGYLSEHYGVARRTIYMAATGQTWTHLRDKAA